MAFIEKERRWWKCNDSVVEICDFPEEMKGVTVLVLEKITTQAMEEAMEEAVEIGIDPPNGSRSQYESYYFSRSIWNRRHEPSADFFSQWERSWLWISFPFH